jgi:predicted amidohydrolase YtcJ
LSGDGSIENLNLKTETVEARIKRLKPIASVQPLHLALDSERALVEKLGRSRMERTHMYKSLSELTTIAFGSDVPIAPANPLEAILQASTKRTLNKEGQSMSVEMALEAQTIGGARASFNEDAFGGFFNGALMDFVVLKKKSSATSNSKEKEESKEEERGEEEIIDDRSIVYETWVGGRKVYSTA